MSQAQTLHIEAMQKAADAFAAQRSGDYHNYLQLTKQAFEPFPSHFLLSLQIPVFHLQKLNDGTKHNTHRFKISIRRSNRFGWDCSIRHLFIGGLCRKGQYFGSQVKSGISI